MNLPPLQFDYRGFLNRFFPRMNFFGYLCTFVIAMQCGALTGNTWRGVFSTAPMDPFFVSMLNLGVLIWAYIAYLQNTRAELYRNLFLESVEQNVEKALSQNGIHARCKARTTIAK